ncbi:hypothetical protein SAMN05216486_10150 [bacterium JGI 053]|nr:hypothetical protein SAMN05216486_10150 [bacterium JGI 053]
MELDRSVFAVRTVIVRRTVVAFGGALVLMQSACRDVIRRSYDFELPSARLASGGRISLVPQGRSDFYDSAGVSISRSGSPYRIEVFIVGHRRVDVSLAAVQLTGVQSGRSTSPAFPPLRLLDDSTLFAISDRVDLAFEDQGVVIDLEASGDGARRETVRLVMRRRYFERHLTLLDRIKRIRRSFVEE